MARSRTSARWAGPGACRRRRVAGIRGLAVVSRVRGFAVTGRPLGELVEQGWAEALDPVADRITRIGEFLRAENEAGRGYLPKGENVLRAFQRSAGQGAGADRRSGPLSDSGTRCGPEFLGGSRCLVRCPAAWRTSSPSTPSDLGYPTPSCGDLSPWSDQGVLMLNRVLTVQPREAGSHRGKGWEAVTEQAIRALVARDQPLVAILWGRDASTLKPMLGERAVPSNPPIPHRCRPLGDSSDRSRSPVPTNCSARLGAAPVDWRLP